MLARPVCGFVLVVMGVAWTVMLLIFTHHARPHRRPSPIDSPPPPRGFETNDEEILVRELNLPKLLDPSGRSGLLRKAETRLGKQVVKLGAWKRVVGRGGLPSEFCESSAARVEDSVFVAGGFLCDFNRVTDVVQMLNTTTGRWKTVATLPPTAATTHQGMAANRVNENTTFVYLVSGQVGPGCTVGTTESWALMVRKRKSLWFPLPDLPETRYAPSAFLRDGALHVVGGAGPNRRDPKGDHFVLPLLPNGHAASNAGWFRLEPGLPDGGTDSCGTAEAGGFVYRFGGQHGHPRAVNVLYDNNQQCQGSPEVARTSTFRYDGSRWVAAAPMPWPASHVGLSTTAVGDDVFVVSGKLGKVTTNRVALYDAHADEWRELRPVPGKGQPDYLVWVDPSKRFLNALKFRWHPTNTVLNADGASITNVTDGRVIKWPQAYLHMRAAIKWGSSSEVEEERLASVNATTSTSFSLSKVSTKPIHSLFGAEVVGIDLAEALSKPTESLRRKIRSLLDEHGVLLFRSNSRTLEPSELVALHSFFDHDSTISSTLYHRGMCRLWRAGLPEINLLANRAVSRDQTESAGALTDDGLPCVQGAVYGMDAFGWHSDESARPGTLPVQATVFQAAEISNASQQQTHFASAKLDSLPISPADLARALTARMRYAHNPKSLDAFLPPIEIAGKKDAWLRSDGTAKLPHLGDAVDDLVSRCVKTQTCQLHTSPLVTSHPRTRQRVLHLDVKQQLGVAGLNFSESQTFLRRIILAATETSLYKHNWQRNDVVVTDNFQVMHTAAPGVAFNDAPRLIQRICLPGGHRPEPVNPPHRTTAQTPSTTSRGGDWLQAASSLLMAAER